MNSNETRGMDPTLELATVSLRLTPAQLKHLSERIQDGQTVCWQMTPISQLTVAVCDRLADHDGGCYDSRLKARMSPNREPHILPVATLFNPLGNVTLAQDDQLWMSCEWAYRLHLRHLEMDIQPMIDRVCNGRDPNSVFSMMLKDGRTLYPTTEGFKFLYSLGWHEALADKTPPSRIIIPGA